MPSNRGVVYLRPGEVEVQDIDFPTFRNPAGKEIEHGVILKVVATNICGSDQHMVRGRTTAPAGMVLGHEITGEIIEIGRDVEYLRRGDLVSVPFNVACGRCRTCREGDTGVCLNVNPERAGGAYGYVDMGGWIGGQAEYVMVPYADFNCLRFPDKAQALEKIRDLTCLTDILPTEFSWCGHRQGRRRFDRLRRRGGTCRSCCCRCGTHSRCSRGAHRRHEPGAPRPCQEGPVRADRPFGA
jgi:glutathione-independent formaldehyde dehydrogenase